MNVPNVDDAVSKLARVADYAEKKSDRWLFIMCFMFIIIMELVAVVYCTRQNQQLGAELRLIASQQIDANKQMAVALDRNSRALEGHTAANLTKETDGHN